jgi:CTP synthase (UTP-ammonia lyase)
MSRSLRIGLIGDYNPEVTAHRAIPHALALAAEAAGVEAEPVWLPTGEIGNGGGLNRFAALWCVPASPYRSTAGALTAIHFARARALPFLGTCGGFQHAVLEYARSELGWADAEHAELAPDATRAVISPLTCSLVEVTGAVRFAPGSRLAQAYGTAGADEGYHCRYGINPALAGALTAGPLRATAWDAAGDIRGVELAGHPFFVATLFQPERAALQGRVPPIALALVRAAGGVASPV